MRKFLGAVIALYELFLPALVGAVLGCGIAIGVFLLLFH